MTISLPYRFMLASIVFALIGMVLGIQMGISEDHTLIPAHAHLNLAGWATMMLFGLYYRSDPVAAGRPLAHWHFWVALVGLIVFIPGIAANNLGNRGLGMIVIPGSFLVVASMLIFAWTVWQAARRAP